MFVIIEERYKEITLKNSTGQVSSIPNDALMNFVRNTSHNAWEVTGRSFLHKFLVSVCARLQNMFQTLCFSNSPITRNHKPTDRANGLANNRRRSVVIFRKVSKANGRWTADLRSVFLLTGVPSWTYRQLCFMLSPWLPECYVDQNGQWTRPHPYNYY